MFDNISVLSWLSVWSVEKIEKNNFCKPLINLLTLNCFKYKLPLADIKVKARVVIYNYEKKV